MHFILLLDSTHKYTGQWHCERTPKDKLSDPRGSLDKDIPSYAIEQANQNVRQDNRYSQYTHSNFRIFEVCVLFSFVYYIIYQN